MRAFVILLPLFLSVAASSDPYDRMNAYAGILHAHSGTIATLATQAVTYACEPRDVDPCTCAHSFGHPRTLYAEGFSNGLDFVGLSHHTDWIWGSSANITTFLGARSGDYSELGTDHTWHFCDDAGDGLELADGSCSHDGTATEWDWMVDQAVLAQQDAPTKLVLAGGEWTVSDGHIVFAAGTAVSDRLSTICNTTISGRVDGRYVCDNEVGLYRALRDNGGVAEIAHPCHGGSGLMTFRPLNFLTGDGVDPRVTFGMAINGCLSYSSITTAGNDKGANYFGALNAGWHLYPAGSGDTHAVPDCDNCTGNSSEIGSSSRTVVWADSLSWIPFRAALKSRRAYWSKLGKPIVKVYAYDDEADVDAPDAIIGGFVDASDGDFVLQATITGASVTLTDLTVWHNGSEVLDIGNDDISCSGTSCTLAAHEFSSSVGGWWLLIAYSSGPITEIVTAPIWVNRDYTLSLGAPALPIEIVGE